MPNSVYDFLKAMGQVILPAVLTFVGVVGKELGMTNIESFMKIGTAFITMWNTVIVIWNSQYKVQENAKLINNYDTEDRG